MSRVTITTRLDSLMPSYDSPYNDVVLSYLHDFLNGCVLYGIDTIEGLRLELLRYTDDADIDDAVEEIIISILEEYLDNLEAAINDTPFVRAPNRYEFTFKRFWFRGNVIGCASEVGVYHEQCYV